MKESRKELLKRIYEEDQLHGESLEILLKDPETDEFIPNLKELRNDVDYLVRQDYVEHAINLPMRYILRLTEKGETFVQNGCEESAHSSASFDFSGATIHNSVIGNEITGNQFELNASASLSEIQAIIERQSAEDQLVLKELLVVLREMQSSEKAVEKGSLTQFYETVKKCSELFLPIGKFLFCIFSGQVS